MKFFEGFSAFSDFLGFRVFQGIFRVDFERFSDLNNNHRSVRFKSE